MIIGGVPKKTLEKKAGTRFYQGSFVLLVERRGSENRTFRLFTPASKHRANGPGRKGHDLVDSVPPLAVEPFPSGPVNCRADRGSKHVVRYCAPSGTFRETIKHNDSNCPGNSRVEQRTKRSPAGALVFVSVNPQGDPIFSYGPFIGDSKQDIARLFAEYQAGGFPRLSELKRQQDGSDGLRESSSR